MTNNSDLHKEVDQFYRKYFGKLVASLTYFFDLSNLAISEDIVQETFISAIKTWPENGIPDEPVNWLFKVCKNKALNQLKSKSFSINSAHIESSIFESEEVNLDYKIDQVLFGSGFEDAQLQLLFSICHPKISTKAQIIFALKTICGFKRSEIAQGLGMNEESVKKNLFRTRKFIADENLTFNLPYLTKSVERIETVEMVLYLMFNEGYKATEGESLMKFEFCLEAMKLVKSMLTEISDNLYSTKALFALMLFNSARFDERKDVDGNLVDLESQNRTNWDKDLIMLGIDYFNASKPSQHYHSRFHIEAGIASIHCHSSSFNNTDWINISKLYDRLVLINPSEYTQLSRCIAILYGLGPKKALEEIKVLKLETSIGDYYLLNCALGEIHQKLSDNITAFHYYNLALQQTKNRSEQVYIKEQMLTLQKLLPI